MTQSSLPDASVSGGALRAVGRAVSMAALVLPLLAASGASAGEAQLNARYSVRLAVLPINFASGTLTAKLPDNGRYTVDFGAQGLGFAMSGKSVGTIVPRGLSPASAAIDTSDSSEKRSIRIIMTDGAVRRESVTPPLPYRPDRVPILQQHRMGVIDPISALVMPVSVKGAPLDAGNCDRTLPIFEGTERFDIRMSYLRTEQVKTVKGYEGPAIVCKATYKAIAGHRRRKQVETMENQTMEAWLAPIEGTEMLAPWRISLATGVGLMIIEAAEFTTTGGTKHADAGDSSPPSETGTAR